MKDMLTNSADFTYKLEIFENAQHSQIKNVASSAWLEIYTLLCYDFLSNSWKQNITKPMIKKKTVVSFLVYENISKLWWL
jgi:hypothetical protein